MINFNKEMNGLKKEISECKDKMNKIKDEINEIKNSERLLEVQEIEKLYNNAIETEDPYIAKKLFIDIINTCDEKKFKYKKMSNVYSEIANKCFELFIKEKCLEEKYINEAFKYYDLILDEYKLEHNLIVNCSTQTGVLIKILLLDFYQKKLFIVTQKIKLCLYNIDHKMGFELVEEALKIVNILLSEENKNNLYKEGKKNTQKLLAEIYYCQAFCTILDPTWENIDSNKTCKKAMEIFKKVCELDSNPIFSFMSYYSLAYLNHYLDGNISETKQNLKMADNISQKINSKTVEKSNKFIDNTLYQGITKDLKLLRALVIQADEKNYDKLAVLAVKIFIENYPCNYLSMARLYFDLNLKR